MERERGGTDAAQTATVIRVIDDLSTKSAQLHSLMVLLMQAARDREMPRAHLETACWLACDLAAGIGSSVMLLGEIHGRIN
jgi:Arc/MetJ family transcription regulator